MTPEREGVVGGRPSLLWHTPTPYLLLGLAAMMALMAVALLVLICTRHKASRRTGRGTAASSSGDLVDPRAPSSSSLHQLRALDREPPIKVAVVMAGDRAPSFLATAKPLAAAFVPSAGDDDGAVVFN